MGKGTCAIDGCTKLELCRGWCSKHYTRWQRHGDPLITTRTPPIEQDATDKWCPRCETIKPLAEFGVRPGGRPKGYCSPCEQVYQAGYPTTESGGPARRRASRKWSQGPRHEFDLQKRYGIGVADYEALLEKQAGRCAICGTERPSKSHPASRRWNVDHCHVDNHVRGLLCNNCNLGIGKFADDPARLRAAADYIEQSRPSRKTSA